MKKKMGLAGSLSGKKQKKGWLKRKLQEKSPGRQKDGLKAGRGSKTKKLRRRGASGVAG